MQYPNKVSFRVYGPWGLFSDPLTRAGGEKFSYQIPTYEALKGIASSIYWKPTFTWYIDRVRVMNRIQTETAGVRLLRYNGGSDISFCTYLKNCDYQVEAHFEWALSRPELEEDRNENKHFQIAERMIRKGGRRDVFLGTRECQAYVEPCVFGEGKGDYDDIRELAFGPMYHGLTYPDEAYSDDTKNRITLNMWYPVMKNGIITFPRPEECPLHKPVEPAGMKTFYL